MYECYFLSYGYVNCGFSVKIAVYGLGSIRDERLNRAFAEDRVKFVRPEMENKEIFNIFVLHQNR